MRIFLRIIYIVTFTSTICWSQKNPTHVFMTAEINSTTSMRDTEVTIREWFEFIASNNYNPALFPDSTVIKKVDYQLLFDDLKLGTDFRFLKKVETDMEYGSPIRFILFKKKYEKVYGKIDDPLRLPITGVSYDQAEAFCKWKEGVLNLGQPTERRIKIILPSVEIYKHLIENIDSLCSSKCGICNIYLINYAHIVCPLKKTASPFQKAQGHSLVIDWTYNPSKLGLYCLQGNAAEMTSTKGVAMGGSYKHTARQSYNDQKQEYTKPEEWLGFRYVVTLAKP